MTGNARIKCMSCVRSNLLTIFTLIGVVVGSVLGIVLRSSRDEAWTQREVIYIQFVGDLFLRILKGLVLPLVVSTLIAAIGSLDLSVSGKMARVGGIYYVITTTLAIILGIVLAVTIQPGANRSGTDTGSGSDINVRNVTTVDTLLDLVRNMFPPNYVQACTQQYQTVIIPPEGYDERKFKRSLIGVAVKIYFYLKYFKILIYFYPSSLYRNKQVVYLVNLCCHKYAIKVFYLLSNCLLITLWNQEIIVAIN